MGMMNGSGGAARDFSSSALGGFTSTDNLVSAVGQQIDFKPGRTIWLAFQSTGTVASTTETILACRQGTFASGKGFWLTRAGTASGSSASRFYILAPGNSAAELGAANQAPSFGITLIAIVWRVSGNVVTSVMNGGPAINSVSAIPGVAVDATCTCYMGGPESGLGSIALTSGRVLALAVWSAEATTLEMQSGTFPGTGTRMNLPASVTGSASCTFDFVAARDFVPGAATCVTRGSSPVTFSVNGTPALATVAERRYAAAGSLYADSKRAESAVTAGGYAFTVRDTYARIGVTTDARHIGVECLSTMQSTFAPQSAVGLYNGGTYVSQTTITQDSIPQMFDIQAPAGSAKALRVWEGEQNETNGTTRVGTFVQAIRVPLYLSDGVTAANGSLLPVTPPQKRLILIGDSIFTGFYATTPHQGSLPALVRQDYPTSGTGGVTAFCAGTESAHNLASDTAAANATAALIAASCDGTVSNTIWIQLGTNDYGFLARASASFAVEYARLVDAIHAAVPAAILYLQSPFQRISPSTEAANSAGSTLPNFRTAISTVASARAGWTTYIEGGGGAIVSDANMYSDGIHMVDAGFAQAKAAMKVTLAY